VKPGIYPISDCPECEIVEQFKANGVWYDYNRPIREPAFTGKDVEDLRSILRFKEVGEPAGKG
jgi:hypothetical protein